MYFFQKCAQKADLFSGLFFIPHSIISDVKSPSTDSVYLLCLLRGNIIPDSTFSILNFYNLIF